MKAWYYGLLLSQEHDTPAWWPGVRLSVWNPAIAGRAG